MKRYTVRFSFLVPCEKGGRREGEGKEGKEGREEGRKEGEGEKKIENEGKKVREREGRSRGGREESRTKGVSEGMKERKVGWGGLWVTCYQSCQISCHSQ
jgi:hypothetical protein